MQTKIDLFEKENNEIFALMIMCHIYGIDFKAAYNRDRPDLQIDLPELSLGIEVTIALDQRVISALKLLDEGKLIRKDPSWIDSKHLIMTAIKKKLIKAKDYRHDFAKMGLFIYCFETSLKKDIFADIAALENIETYFDQIYLYNYSDIYIYDCHKHDLELIHLNFLVLKKLLKQLHEYIG